MQAGKYGNITSIVEWDNDVPVRCIECEADEHNYITSSGYTSDCEYLYSYEFDPQGNWTKRVRTTIRHWRETKREVDEIIIREITYY